jgi:hypothetical protein
MNNQRYQLGQTAVVAIALLAAVACGTPVPQGGSGGQPGTTEKPVLLANQFHLRRILVGPTALYTRSATPSQVWQSGPGVWGIFEIPFDGRAPRAILDFKSASDFNPFSFYGRGTAVTAKWFLGCDASLWRAALSGGPLETLVDETAICDVVATETHAYFSIPNAGRLGKVPIDGGTVEPVATGQSSPGILALDATHLYWTGAAAIYSLPLAGGAPVVLTSGDQANNATKLELDSSHVYWQTAEGALRRVRKQGGRVETLPLAASCADFAVDDAFVYCAAELQLIRRRNDGRGADEVLATGYEQRIKFVGVDSANVYFVVAGQYVPTQSTEADRIFKLPKP